MDRQLWDGLGKKIGDGQSDVRLVGRQLGDRQADAGLVGGQVGRWTGRLG